MSSDSNSNPTSSSRKSILLSVPPSALRSNSSTQFLALPHPRSNVPTYFLPTTSRTETATETSLTQSEYLESEKLCDRILELKVIRPEKAQRSWFVATPQKEDQQERDEQRRRKDQDPIQDHGQVIADGALHTLSPIDPIFLLLPMFKPSLDSTFSTHFLPSEDFFEQASINLHRSLIRSQNSKTSSSNSVDEIEEEGSWEDVIRFGNTKSAIDGLGRVSEVQEISSTLKVYRPSTPKVLSLLTQKLEQLSTKGLFEKAPNTLGRALARSTDEGCSEKEEFKARRKIARGVLEGYLNEDWREVWKEE